VIIPEGEQTHLLGYEDRRPSSDRPIRFLARGEAYLGRDSVEQEFSRLISAVLTRLAEKGITDTPLEKEWAEIRRTDPEEAELCIAAARLGLDPYAEAAPYERLIVQAAEELRGNLLGDFRDAVEPALMSNALEWVRLARSDIGQGQQAMAANDLRRELRPPGLSPGDRSWENGWSQARAVRQALGLSDREAFVPASYISTIDRPAALDEPGMPRGSVDNAVAARIERQAVFDRDRPSMMWAVLDEVVLQRRVGDAAVMRGQLEHLLAVAEHPSITVQIVPLAAGFTAGLLEAFVLARVQGHDIAYLESAGTGVVTATPEEVHKLQIRFDAIRAHALPQDVSHDLVKEWVQRWMT
jgi:hypothetical protein